MAVNYCHCFGAAKIQQYFFCNYFDMLEPTLGYSSYLSRKWFHFSWIWYFQKCLEICTVTWYRAIFLIHMMVWFKKIFHLFTSFHYFHILLFKNSVWWLSEYRFWYYFWKISFSEFTCRFIVSLPEVAPLIVRAYISSVPSLLFKAWHEFYISPWSSFTGIYRRAFS